MANDDVARPMIAWLNSVPPGDLATELMAAFGPNGTKGEYHGNPRWHAVVAASGHARSLNIGDLIKWLFEGHRYPRPSGCRSSPYPDEVGGPMLEAVQLLVHAELVCESTMVTSPKIEGEFYWRETRFGLATLANGKAAVRQRITDRTGL